MIVTNQANVLPSQWCNMCHSGFWNVLTPFAQRGNCFGKIDLIPGGDSGHN